MQSKRVMGVGVFLAATNKTGNSHRRKCKSVEKCHGPRVHLVSRLHTLWDSCLPQQGNSSPVGTKTGWEWHVERNWGGQPRVGCHSAPEASGGNTGKVSRESQPPTCPGAPWKYNTCNWGHRGTQLLRPQPRRLQLGTRTESTAPHPLWILDKFLRGLWVHTGPCQTSHGKSNPMEIRHDSKCRLAFPR